MRPFLYDRATTADGAPAALGLPRDAPRIQGRLPAEYLAGGTTLLDLMKLDVMRPARVVDITPLERGNGAIAVSPAGLRLGALVKMSAAADHPDIVRTYPVLAQSLTLAASAQLRTMAPLGGNVLPRTR